MLAILLLAASLQPTPAQIRNAVDTWLSNRWSAIQTMQANYLAAHGRYWQGLKTHSVRPADGAETAPDLLNDKPTDQAHRWSDVFTLPATMPARVTINVYDGPQGRGYEAIVSVKIGSDVWRRVAQVGPETHRARGWHRVTEAGL